MGFSISPAVSDKRVPTENEGCENDRENAYQPIFRAAKDLFSYIREWDPIRRPTEW
jgi:hypothetical protein